MYSAKWSPGLRQGDILGPIPLPLLGTDFSVVIPSRTLIAPAAADKFSVNIPAERMIVTVISHDCEFNEGKRNKLLVARLQKPRGNLTPEERQDLRYSNDVNARVDANLDIAAVNAFLFDPVAGVFEDEQVSNFETITALPMKMADDLRGQKRAELDQATRVLFRLKLAWFVSRAAEDIPEEEKVDPPAESRSAP